MKPQVFAITSALWMSCLLAWDPSERDCSEVALCLTSFKWCDASFGGSAGCYYPEGVYPVSPYTTQSIIALVMEDVDHTISWKVDPQNRDIPVRVQWSLGNNVTWEVNTTETQIKFNPRSILNVLAPGLPVTGNINTAEAAYNVFNSMGNAIWIDQPEAARPNGNGPGDHSNQFIVASHWTREFLEAQKDVGHDEEYKKWRLGIGIGVGLGAPILTAGTAMGTWAMAKKMGLKRGDAGVTPPKA